MFSTLGSLLEHATLAACANPEMSVIESKDHNANVHVTAEDLLQYDESQLVQYLENNKEDKGFNISSLIGVRKLSKVQREDLASKLT